MWASLRVDKILGDFLVIPLNIQWETKIKINGKPCQILVDTKGTLSTLTPTLKSADGILGKSSEPGKG